MNELNINYGEISQTRKIANIITGIYLAGFTLYFTITEGIASRYGVLFFCALAGFIFATIIVLSNTLWLPGPLLKIDNNSIIIALPQQIKTTIDWTNVSRVNIGTSYIVFLLNGEKKQKKMDITRLTYEDVMTVKAKIIEMCEHKNIPYHND
ncbi:hypothetical protein [Prevotella sp. 10(H)]|uniref:hypothetical protein n=1 Tax=Prevotella sp. 10(H) TaxID=1158294 RepID=UPI0004A73767|nr:hypothetical protein [Prevotella sp. 10(H)]